MDENALESALGQAFGGEPAPAAPAPAKPAAPAPVAEPADEAEPVEAVEADDEDAEGAEPAEQEAAEQEEAPVAEPEFEIEVNGAKELVRGQEAIKELLQKGRDYMQKTEQVARARDTLIAQAQQQALAVQIQQVLTADWTEIQALDGQLEQYNKIDWATAFDSDPFNALKLKEQRDQLREQRANKVAQFTAKQRQLEAGQAEASQKRLAAEQQALIAKLPEWSNSDVAQKEQRAITSQLANYGFNEAEIAQLVDHRMLLVARDAMQWRALQASKPAQLKQVRQAPPVVKPGAVSPDAKAKAEAREFTKELRKAGRQNDHRTQERLLEKALARTFK